MKLKSIFITALVSLSLCSCSSGDSVYKTAKNTISDNLSEKITINKCCYSQELNAVYVDFSSSKHGDDIAFITLDDNNVYYESVYNSIDISDYDKIKENKDALNYSTEYAILSYQFNVNGGWEIISN